MVARRQKPIKRSRIRKRPRKPSETLRIYGGKKRIEWVKAQKCSACGHTPHEGCENAHIENGGTGRKADFDKIIPLCLGCHFALDVTVGREKFARYFGINLDAIAADVQARWLAFSSSPKTENPND